MRVVVRRWVVRRRIVRFQGDHDERGLRLDFGRLEPLVGLDRDVCRLEHELAGEWQLRGYRDEWQSRVDWQLHFQQHLSRDWFLGLQ
jgi:hypothetical protein